MPSAAATACGACLLHYSLIPPIVPAIVRQFGRARPIIRDGSLRLLLNHWLLLRRHGW